ncbi:hypothetical protein HY967_01925 [Candidatus Jorgensenbacteria bacterium]|nr:hypothetical protein [Candidatus Jorgensenbacteria bacterium]
MSDDYVKEEQKTRNRKRMMIGAIVFAVITFIVSIVWFVGSGNPYTPAGYVGYVTQGAVFGQAKFIGLQKGPGSPGRNWMYEVTNVSITPYTYTEEFSNDQDVLSSDNLKVSFKIHTIFRINPERIQSFVEGFTILEAGQQSDQVAQIAYNNNLKEPLRTMARSEIQSLRALEIKDKIDQIGKNLTERLQKRFINTPFEITNVVVGNIQYPPQVSNAVAQKLAASQELERKDIEIKIQEKEKQKRIVDAEGIAKAMEIINARLTSQYLQHEAIDAQKAMVNSPNHTTIYLPVGPMGVPIVGTMDISGEKTAKNK